MVVILDVRLSVSAFSTAAAFLAFVALRMLIQEQHVITENVAAFIIAIYKEFLGNIYHIDLEEMTYGDRI